MISRMSSIPDSIYILRYCVCNSVRNEQHVSIGNNGCLHTFCLIAPMRHFNFIRCRAAIVSAQDQKVRNHLRSMALSNWRSQAAGIRDLRDASLYYRLKCLILSFESLRVHSTAAVEHIQAVSKYFTTPDFWNLARLCQPENQAGMCRYCQYPDAVGFFLPDSSRFLR